MGHNFYKTGSPKSVPVVALFGMKQNEIPATGISLTTLEIMMRLSC